MSGSGCVRPTRPKRFPFGVGCQRRSGRGHYRTSIAGCRGEPLDTGDIWLVVIMACANQNSIWDTCNDTNGTPCDDTVLTWLHTLNRQRPEFVANLLLGRLHRLQRQPVSWRTLHRRRRTLFDGSRRWNNHVPSVLHGVRCLQRKAGDTSASDDLCSQR